MPGRRAGVISHLLTSSMFRPIDSVPGILPTVRLDVGTRIRSKQREPHLNTHA